MTIAREVMNMSPSTTTGDVSTTESVWNFLMDPLDVFRFRGMGDGRRVMPSLSQLFVVKVN